jgi:hypothetical protein
MPNYDLERYHFDGFLRVAGISPDAEPLREEAPDFIICIAGNTVGVEHTTFYLPHQDGTPPPQMLHALKWRAVNRAQRLFRERGGPALYVTVHYSNHGPRTNAEADELAETLAQMVLENGWSNTVAEGHRRFDVWRVIPGIHSYSVLPSIDGVDELWSTGSAGFVATVSPEQVQGYISTKDQRYPSYSSRVSQVWLLIVNDEFRGGAPCELGLEARNAAYHFSFDRVYWFDTVHQYVVAFRRRDTV